MWLVHVHVTHTKVIQTGDGEREKNESSLNVYNNNKILKTKLTKKGIFIFNIFLKTNKKQVSLYLLFLILHPHMY